jgi:antigen flippase
MNKPKNQNKEYLQIIRSSSISGISSAVVIALSIVRTKLAAIYLGTSGVGLIQGLNAISGFISNLTSLGMQSSAVRELTRATATGDSVALGHLVVSIRRVCMITGLIGGCITIMLASTISSVTFGDASYSMDISILGFSVFFNTLAVAEIAILQSSGKISEMAVISIFTAFVSVIFSAALYSLCGPKGVAPSLAITSLAQILIARYYSRKIKIAFASMGFIESIVRARDTAKHGMAIIWIGLLVSGISYATVAILTRSDGLNAVGYYSAAYALAGIFVNFLLGSMATDYHPRLVRKMAEGHNIGETVNRQAEITLTIAAPGLLIFFTSAPWLLKIAYSAEFETASELMRMFLLGGLGRIISWPLGFVILASGNIRTLLFVETSANLLQFVLLVTCVFLYGLIGVGIAFCLLYIYYAPLVYFVCKRMYGYKPSREYLGVLCFVSGAFSLLICTEVVFDSVWALTSGLLISALTLVFSYYKISIKMRRNNSM